jgi:hypothetical protein
MRYLIGFVCLLAALVASPLSAGAQTGQEGAASEPNLQEPAPSSEPAPEEPALQLQLDDTGVEVAPGYPPRTAEGYTLEQAEHVVETDRRGLIISSVFFGVGVGALAGGFAWGPHAECGDDDPATFDVCIPPGPIVLGTLGAVMATGGLIGMAIKASSLAKTRSELRELKESHYGKPHRVQWDLARSRLVF